MPVRWRVRLLRPGLVLLLALTTATPALDAQPAAVASASVSSPAAPPGAEDITEAQLRDYLTFVAADELGGRDTPSRGLDVAARFLATLLARWGYEPAGDAGTFFQTIALTRRTLDREQTSLRIGDRPLDLGGDYLPSTAASGSVSGRLVYVGHGYVVKSKSLDPYANVDVRGAVVLMHPGLPAGIATNDLRGPEGDDWQDGPTAAAARGAVAILYLADFQRLASWPDSLAAITRRGVMSVDAFESGEAGDRLPSATLSPASYRAIFSGEALDPPAVHRHVATRTVGPSFVLSARKQASLSIQTAAVRETTQNVVAVMRGSDPVLRDEYVALGAHYDHVGERPDAGPGGDRIYNGADDDGSGTVGLLGMAEAFAGASSRPRRSILFVWHAGEEKGLWGARYVAQHPPVPLDRIVTQINVDMIGRSRAPGDTTPANARLTGPDAVYVIGSRLMSTTLGTLVDDVNDGYLKLTYDYGYADPDHPERFFYRSDHYHYAKHGIPVAFFFTGVHEDYHDVGDEVDKIDFGKMARITRTIYATAWALAELPTRPAVDKPLAQELVTR